MGMQPAYTCSDKSFVICHRKQLLWGQTMPILIWGGAAVSVIGLIGLIISILKVSKAKKTAANDDELREAVKKVVPLNMGALLLSTFGLMMVILGIFLK